MNKQAPLVCLALFYHWLHVLAMNTQATVVWYMYSIIKVTPNAVRSTYNQGHLNNPAVQVSWLTWGFPTDEAERTGTVLVVPGPREILPTCLYLDTESTVIYIIRFTGIKVLKVSLQTHTLEVNSLPHFDLLWLSPIKSNLNNSNSEWKNKII